MGLWLGFWTGLWLGLWMGFGYGGLEGVDLKVCLGGAGPTPSAGGRMYLGGTGYGR